MVTMACETRCRRERCASGRVCHVASRRHLARCRRPGGGPVAHDVVGRYYDLQTEQFLSVDLELQQTLAVSRSTLGTVGDGAQNRTGVQGLQATLPGLFYCSSWTHVTGVGGLRRPMAVTGWRLRELGLDGCDLSGRWTGKLVPQFSTGPAVFPIPTSTGDR